ncbi:MAG: ABC transporter ATP-binding protein [Paenibacillaceae bacterium]|nr:ABC transporter ATP-binding protein [Paenibacillaceae bacterium]
MREKINYRLHVLRLLKPFAFGVKRFLLLSLLTGVLVMILGFVQPLFYKLFIDRVILERNFSLMPIVAAGYLTVFFVNLGLGYYKNYCKNRLVNHVAFRVKMNILRGYFKRSFSDYDRQSVGDMKMRLDDDTACISAYADTQTVDYVIAYATLVISACLLFLIEWRLALFSCAAIPVTFWIDHMIAKREAAVLNQQRENDQKLSSWLHASVQGWREIKALNLRKHEEKQFARYIHQYAIFFGTWINYWVARVLVIPKIKEQFLMHFSLYFLGGLLIIYGHFEIGALLVFMQYYGLLSGAVKTVSGTDAELLTTKPQSDRMMEELYRTAEQPIGKLLPGTGNKIEFRNVSFAYPDTGEPVIRSLSFSIEEGERVGITGKSGSGKTTILKLMTGMLVPAGGTVMFSGMRIEELSPEAMHRRMGLVMQENALFHTSIRENLYYGKNKATDEELESACRKAYIYDFINGLPDGMDTVIGERGIKLSGGQKQRLVLARLFLREVDVFIFDEATSALDQYSESMIHDAMKSIGQDKTIIIVAHRQSSLALCDRVIAI